MRFLSQRALSVIFLGWMQLRGCSRTRTHAFKIWTLSVRSSAFSNPSLGRVLDICLAVTVKLTVSLFKNRVIIGASVLYSRPCFDEGSCVSCYLIKRIFMLLHHRSAHSRILSRVNRGWVVRVIIFVLTFNIHLCFNKCLSIFFVASLDLIYRVLQYRGVVVKLATVRLEWNNLLKKVPFREIS